jgi:TetR/AcrR family transcriptional regulator, mexJK operon transcriptional repressor
MTLPAGSLAAVASDALWFGVGESIMAVAEQVVRRGRKYDQVLAGARSIFMRDGFERASVDDIAREAGVSKATIYAYFPDKQLLFLEVASLECRRQTEEAEASVDGEMHVREMLMIAAQRIVAFLVSDFGQRMFRIVVGEGERFPGLGQQFYENGPGLIHTRLAFHMRHCVECGELKIDDLDLAADQFAQLCKAGVQEKLLFGAAKTVTPAEASRVVTGAVDMFLARYGAKAG